MATHSKDSFTLADTLFAHLETWRPYTVLWCGLVSLAGACMAYGAFPPIIISILAFIVPIMGWVAGLYALDYIDRDLDMIQKPHRPIPSGRLSPKKAIIFAFLLAISGFIFSLFLGLNNILLVFVVAITVLAYAKITKSRGILGNFNRGIVTLTAFIFGVFSVNVSLPSGILLFSLVFLIHDTNSNLVGAIRDREGDEKGGYMTVPVQYGNKKSVFIALLLSIVWISMILLLTSFYDVLKFLDRFYIVFILAIMILIAMYFFIFRSIDDFDRKKALRAHEFFVAERTTLASAFIFGMISNLYISISIFIIAISITLISQYLIRYRYEFMESI